MQLFKNDDVNPDKSVKRKRFLEKNNVAEVKAFVGEDVDFEAAFDELDEEKKGKVRLIFFLCFLVLQIKFGKFLSWAFKNSMAVEIALEEERKRVVEEATQEDGEDQKEEE